MEHYTRGQALSQIRNLHGKADPAPDMNLWSWGPMKNHLLAAPVGKGYKGVPRTVGTIVQASLMSQLYDFDLVMQQNLPEKAMMWAREEDIERAEECPVILCHSIDSKEEKEDHVYLLGPLPVPYHGSYAFVQEGENLVLYFIESMPEGTRAKFKQVRQKIIDLADMARPDNIDHMWVDAMPIHRSVADEQTFQALQQQIVSNILSTRDPQQRADLEERLTSLLTYHNHILMIDRLLQLSDYTERFQEIAHMMQDLAADYYAFHLAQIAARTHDKKDTPPAALGIFDGKVLVATNQPFLTTMEAVQNAASGADRWQVKDKQPPFYSRQTMQNTTIIEYGRTAEQEVFEDKAISRLWKDVKGFSSPEEQIEGFKDRDGDLLLYIFSAIIKENDGKDGAWIHAKQFREQRGKVPIMKKEGAVTRRAGERGEDLADIERSIYRLSGLWINIHEIFPPRKKGGKQRVYTHKGRMFAVMETWTQNTLGDGGELQERVPIAWKIKIGDWLKEYLDAPRYTAYLCDQSLKYDPYRELWEKRLSRYFLFFLRINARHSSSTLTRSIDELIQANSLQLDKENPQRTRDRFEKAMNRLLADKQIDGWEYVPETAELPAKKWLDIWLKWQVRISVRARPALP